MSLGSKPPLLTLNPLMIKVSMTSKTPLHLHNVRTYPWRSSCRATPSRAWWSPRWRYWWRWAGAPGWAPSPPGRSWRLSSFCDTGLMLWCSDQYIWSQMMPADETPGITDCLSLPDAGHWMSAESCDGGTLRLRQCVVWGQEAASPYICRRVPCVPRPPPILLHSGLGPDHHTLTVYLTFMTHLVTTWPPFFYGRNWGRGNFH